MTRTISLTQRLLNQLQAMLSKNRDLQGDSVRNDATIARCLIQLLGRWRATFDLADQSKMQLLERFKASNFCK